MSAAGLGQEWIIAAVLILAGLGVVWALSRSQRDVNTRDSARTPNQQVVNDQRTTDRDGGPNESQPSYRQSTPT